MYPFVRKCFLLSGLLILIPFIISILILPPFWGNERLQGKINYINSSGNNYDTYFVGSSRVNNQINPEIFDSICNTKSFNLGVGGCIGLEAMQIVEYLIENDSKNKIKNILVEFPSSQLAKNKNAKTIRATYYMSFFELAHSINSSAMTNGFYNSIMSHHVNISTYIKNKLSLGNLKAKIIYFLNEKPLYNEKESKKLIRGYYPLIGKLKREKTYLSDNKMVTKELLSDMISKTEKVYRAKKNGKANEKWADHIDQINQLAMSKEINLEFVIFPKANFVYYNSVQKIIKYLKNKIDCFDLANPKKNIRFYQYKYSFDRAHLNKEGSNRLTQSMARMFAKKENQ